MSLYSVYDNVAGVERAVIADNADEAARVYQRENPPDLMCELLHYDRNNDLADFTVEEWLNAVKLGNTVEGLDQWRAAQLNELWHS